MEKESARALLCALGVQAEQAAMVEVMASAQTAQMA